MAGQLSEDDFREHLAEQVAAGCPSPELEHAGGYCPFLEAAKLIRASTGTRLVPDAVEQLARWLWIQDAGGDSAWPYAGEELRRPFIEAAEDIHALIAAPSGNVE
jgi:hypothetical protein